MGVWRGEHDFVLGMRNIFLLRSPKQEREAKFGMRERGNANLRTREKIFIQERRNATAKSRNASTRDAKALRNARPSLIKTPLKISKHKVLQEDPYFYVSSSVFT